MTRASNRHGGLPHGQLPGQHIDDHGLGCLDRPASNERARMAIHQEVRRLVLLIMISSPVPTWNLSALAKVSRIRSRHIRETIDDLIEMHWVQQADDRDGFWSFLRAPAYHVTEIGYANGIADLVSHRTSLRRSDDPKRPLSDSLTGLLPIVGDIILPAQNTIGQEVDLQAPPLFALCRIDPGRPADAVAWGLQFSGRVVLTSFNGEPLGSLPDLHAAKRLLARRLGTDKDALHTLWMTPRKLARSEPRPTVVPGDFLRLP